MNPTGGVAMGHVVETPSPDDHLLERVPSRENMQRAWKRVKANKGAAGIDGMTIEAFPDFVRDHWEDIREAPFAGTYQPSPVRRKVRNLLKPDTSLDAAISVAMSRKGPWRPARTLAIQTNMTNQWLKDQGLSSVKELWVKIRYPATAR
jgi:hypothetical protein